MEVGDASPALRERLGPDATVGLLAPGVLARGVWALDVTNQAIERFEHELACQIGGIRTEVRELDVSLRRDIRDGDATIRLEMRDMGVALVREIAALDSTLRQEMADQRVELLNWSFAFWVAQFVGIGGLMAILLRSFLP